MAKYLLRLDDGAHFMAIDKWARILNLCDEFNVKPLIAVIPNVKDPDLLKYGKISGFWNLVKEWQNKGYYIGLHGYNHMYNSSDKGMITPRPKSEFSGLTKKEQKAKILLGLKKFKEEDISVNIFVAPGHSFDIVTIKALIECGIEYLYDGFFIDPMKYKGINWIPQQLWKGKKYANGTWTICLHPNTITENEITELEGFLSKNSNKFISVEEIELINKKSTRFYNIARNYIIVKKAYLKFYIKKIVSKF